MEQGDDEAVPLVDVEERFAQAFRKATAPEPDPQEQMMRGIIASLLSEAPHLRGSSEQERSGVENKMLAAFKQVQSRISHSRDSPDDDQL